MDSNRTNVWITAVVAVAFVLTMLTVADCSKHGYDKGYDFDGAPVMTKTK